MEWGEYSDSRGQRGVLIFRRSLYDLIDFSEALLWIDDLTRGYIQTPKAVYR